MSIDIMANVSRAGVSLTTTAGTTTYVPRAFGGTLVLRESLNL